MIWRHSDSTMSWEYGRWVPIVGANKAAHPDDASVFPNGMPYCDGCARYHGTVERFEVRGNLSDLMLARTPHSELAPLVMRMHGSVPPPLADFVAPVVDGQPARNPWNYRSRL